MDGHTFVIALYSFEPVEDYSISLTEGETYEVNPDEPEEREWILVTNSKGEQGYVPRNYVEFVQLEEEDETVGSTTGAANFLRPWSAGDISRGQAEAVLRKDGRNGVFLIRNATAGEGFSLSVYSTELNCVYHYRIHVDECGQLFITERQTFSTLKELVDYYKEFQAGLKTKITNPPTKRVRGFVPKINVEEVLKEDRPSDWFVLKMDRNIAEVKLKEDGRDGAFLVRTADQNAYTLSLYSRKKNVKHYKIHHDDEGKYYFKSVKQFDTLADLVFYHQHNATGMATKLKHIPKSLTTVMTPWKNTFEFWRSPAREVFACQPCPSAPVPAAASAITVEYEILNWIYALEAAHEQNELMMENIKSVIEEITCIICRGSPQPPVLFATCCKTILGCNSCLATENFPDTLSHCPHCRAPKGQHSYLKIAGLDRFWELLRKLFPAE